MVPNGLERLRLLQKRRKKLK